MAGGRALLPGIRRRARLARGDVRAAGRAPAPGGDRPRATIAVRRLRRLHRPAPARHRTLRDEAIVRARRPAGLGTRPAPDRAADRGGGAIGYRRLVLDTLPQMQAAQHLYAAFGFRDIEAYYHNPIPGARYLALDLATG